jgi:hypothetical protein
MDALFSMSGIILHGYVHIRLSTGVGKSLSHISTVPTTTNNYSIPSIHSSKESVESGG